MGAKKRWPKDVVADSLAWTQKHNALSRAWVVVPLMRAVTPTSGIPRRRRALVTAAVWPLTVAIRRLRAPRMRRKANLMRRVVERASVLTLICTVRSISGEVVRPESILNPTRVR
jgi:hypothetical protein